MPPPYGELPKRFKIWSEVPTNHETKFKFAHCHICLHVTGSIHNSRPTSICCTAHPVFALAAGGRSTNVPDVLYLQIYTTSTKFSLWRREGLHGRVDRIGLYTASRTKIWDRTEQPCTWIWMQGPLRVLSELKPAGCCRAVRSDSTQLRGADVVRPCIASGPWVSGLPLVLPA